MGHKASADQRDPKESRGPTDPEEMTVWQGQPARQDPRVRREKRGHRVEPRGIRDPPESRGPWAEPALQDPRDRRDPEAPSEEPRVRRGHREGWAHRDP